MFIRQVSLNFDSLANKVDELRLNPRVLQDLPRDLQDFLQTVTDKMDDMDSKWKSSLYGVDDVTAPHHSQQVLQGQQPVVYPQFYQLLKLPVDKLSVEFIDENNWNNRSHDSQRKILQDMDEYRRYFKDYLSNNAVDVSRYSFTSTLYYTFDSKKQKLKILPHFLSGWNILQLTSCLNDIIYRVKKDWDMQLNLMMNHQNFLKFFKSVFELHPNVNEVCKMLLQCPNMLQLIHQIVAMLSEKGTNLISTVKAGLIEFVEADKHRDQCTILKEPKVTVSHIKYAVEDNILKIRVCSKLTPSKKIEVAPTSRAFGNLINNKDFYDCIFQSTQQLTNYFLERRTIEQEIHRMANSLSQTKSKMIHLTVDYDSLYSLVKSLQKTMSLDDYRQLIGGIRHYLLSDLESKLVHEYQSGSLNNTYQLYLQMLVENSQHWNQPNVLMERFNSKSVCFPINAYKSPLKYSFNCYSFFDVKDKNSFSNCFALHIYRSYFTTSFMLGNIYVLGYKRGSKILHLTSANSIHEVDMENLQWVLWITRKIPEDLVVDSSKVIGLYVIDLAGNLFQFSQEFKNIFINPEKYEQIVDIHNLIPVVPSNIAIKFNNSQKPLAPTTDNNISNQTINLNINVKSNTIKQTPFRYPQATLLHCLRFSGAIQARVSEFCKTVGNLYDHNSNLVLKFTQNDKIENQPEMSVFQNLISETLNHIEKLFENICQIERRDKIVEENVIVFHAGASLKKNYIIAQRLQQIKNRLQTIEIHFTSQPKGSVAFSNNSVVVKLSMNGLPKNAKQKHETNILTSNSEINVTSIQIQLVDWLIKQFSMPKPYIDTKFQQKVEFKPNDFEEKAHLLDAILLTSLQQENCRLVVNCLQQLRPKKYYNFEHILVGSGSSTIQLDGTTVKLILNVRQNRLHPFFVILSKILDVENEPLFDAESNMFTEALNGTIFVYNSNEPVSSLIVARPQNMKVEILKPQAEKINGKTIKISDDMSQYKGHGIYIVLTPKSLAYNVLDWPTEENLKFYNIILDQKITFSYNVLLSSCTTTDLDKIKLTFSEKTKPAAAYDNKIKLQDMGKNKYIDITLLTRNVVSITFWSATFSLIKINKPGAYFPHNLRNNDLKPVQIVVSSINQVSFDRTRFLGVKKSPKETVKHYVSKAEQEDQNLNVQKFKIFKQPTEKVPFIRSPQESSKVDFGEILKNQRHLNVVKEQRKYITRSGVERRDILIFCDEYDNPVKCNIKEMQIFFQYMDNAALRMYPEVRQQGQEIHLVWQPFVRGRYRLHINNAILNTGYEIIVCASEIDRSKTEIMLPHMRNLSYCQTSSFTVKYKDRFGNIFSDLEYEMYDESVLLQIVAYEIGCSEVTPLIVQKSKEVDKLGCQTCEFSFGLPDGNDENFEKKFNANILFMREFLEMFELSVKGLSVEKRRKFFNDHLNKINKSPMLDINVNRYEFLEKILTLADTDLKRVISIKFDGQPGVDAGGLRRQFFDLVGVQLKNSKYPFFKPIIMPNKTQYMLNPQLLKNKKKQVYMKVFGKLLANSILNNYLIGIEFADAFIKALYGKEIEFADMKDLVPTNEYSRYEMLTKCKPQQIESMMLDFTVMEGGKQVELQPGGAEKEVTKANVSSYLDKVADYYIRKRYDNLIDSFLKGFNEVFDFELLKKWFRPHEITIFTCGIKTIDANTIIQVLAFDGYAGSNQIKDWFKRYIREADTDLLTKFLKFVTGSSSIPFDTSSYKIEILFVGGNTKKLPISHTCWKSLEVPMYSSYAIMEKKLTAAFTFGAEGFGFS